jgi:sugar phosphate isomerase/epimerase
MAETNVGVCLDTGHASSSGDLYKAVYKLSYHLQLIHANDNTGKGDDNLPPGKGNIQRKCLISVLHKTGFNGSLILELSGETDLESILADAQAAWTYLRNICNNFRRNQRSLQYSR